MHIVTIIVLRGFLANSNILVPMYAMENIITDLPNKTARINCCLLTLDIPATTLINDEGENGKQSNKNNGPKPCLSTHEVT